MENPCYNRRTKESCPNRHGGCSVTCEKWQEYLSRRNQRYQEKAQEQETKRTFIDFKRNLIKHSNKRR